jgi:hypothetical protein
MLKLHLCKVCKNDFEKSDKSSKFEIELVRIKDCEFCKDRLEKVTNSYNTEDGQQHDIGNDECESGVCPVR